MKPNDKALAIALRGLETLGAHRSPWVKEVVRKTLIQIDDLVDTVPILKDYEIEWKKKK